MKNWVFDPLNHNKSGFWDQKPIFLWVAPIFFPVCRFYTEFGSPWTILDQLELIRTILLQFFHHQNIFWHSFESFRNISRTNLGSQFDTDNCDNSHWLQYYNPMRFHPGVIFRPDELQLCRRDGILHRGGISLGCNIVTNEIPPRCDIPSRRVTTMPSGRNIAPGWNLTGL